MRNHTRFKLLLAGLLAVIASSTMMAIGAPTVSQNAVDQARADFGVQHPEGGLLDLGPRLRRAWGARLATGDTPAESGSAFFQQWAAMWGVDAQDLEPVGPFEDGAHLISIPGSDQSNTDFTGVYFTQTAAGVPVFRSYGWALARNDAGFPVVLAGGTLRPIGDFSQQIAGRNLDQSSLNPGIYTRYALNEFGAMPAISTPRYVVWAGVDDDVQAPVLAVEFVAEGKSAVAQSEPLKMQYVVDASTGVILYSESKILHTGITGTVTGWATNGKRADICDPETSQRLPFIKVKITVPGTGATSSVFADSVGHFDTGNVSGPRELQPLIGEGQFFQIVNQAGDTISVASKTPPIGGTANFDFNASAEPVRTELTTAQINAYIEANRVRSFALAASPSYPIIGTQTTFPIYVNIDDVCNAYFDGSSLNFFKTGGGCNNTAFSSVVHHEYGHNLVQCGGSGQGAFGEGFGDTMAVLVNDDPKLGVGFQNCASPLRNAQNTCQYSPGGCSTCGSEAHACGQLLSGIIWDMRQGFIGRFPLNYLVKIGALALNEVPLHAGQSDIAGDIQIDYLTLDDNNGNLFDGTPNSDLINAAFALHGFGAPRTPTGVTASDGTFADRVRVTWNELPGYTSFKIFRASQGVPSAQIGTSSTTTYDDMTAVIGTVYTYSVQAVNPIGTSASSGTDTGYLSFDSPTGTTASDGTFTDQVQVAWNASAGATGYKIYRKEVTPQSGAGFSILDFQTGQSSALVPAPSGAKVKSIIVTINNLTHTWQGDLTVKLTHGTTDCIIGDLCNDGTDFSGTYVLDDSALVDFCHQPGIGGTYKPVTTFSSAFGNQNPAGTWTLSFHDQGPGDIGGADSWNISVLSQIGTSSTTTFSDTTATAGVLYSYSVAAVMGGADSAPSVADTGWKRVSTPSGVSASDALYYDRIIVNWNPVDGATGYQVFRGIGNGPLTQIATTTDRTYTDLTAEQSTVYMYAIIALCPTGNSAMSASDAGSRTPTLPPPTNVQASDGLFTYKVGVTWTPVYGATSYLVYRGDSPNPIATIYSGTASSYSDTSAAVLTVYSYSVRAMAGSVTSAASASDSGFRSPVVTPPLNVAASDGTSTDRVLITWAPVAGATYYQVFRSGSAVPIGTASGADSVMFSDTTAQFGVYYTYQVKSGNAAGTSDVSNKDLGFRKIRAPGNVSATDGTVTGRVVVTWNITDGATGYKIYRNGAETAIGSTPTGTTTTFTDFSAVMGTIYTYTVRANCPTGLSADSVGDTGFVGSLTRPTGVAATDGTYFNKVLVSWTKLVGATGYKVYRDGVLAGGTTGNAAVAFNDTAAVPGIVYTYTVRGVTINGLTDPSTGDTGFRNVGGDDGNGGHGSGGVGNNGGGTGGGGSGSALNFAGSNSAGGAAGAANPAANDSSNASANDGEGSTAAKAGQDFDLRTPEEIRCDGILENAMAEMMNNPKLADSIADRLTLDEDLDGVMDVCQRQRGDINLDGIVNAQDLTALLEAFESGDMRGDINLDGEIDGADIGMLLLSFDEHSKIDSLDLSDTPAVDVPGSSAQ